MRKTLALVFLLSIFQVACAQTSAKNDLAELKNSLQENLVCSVVVLKMPDRIFTRTDITPELLRHSDSRTHRSTIQMSDSGAKLIMQWANNATLIRTQRSPDLRWGLLFMSRDGKEVASLFSDSLGQVGYVSGHNVEFLGPPLLDVIHGFAGPAIR